MGLLDLMRHTSMEKQPDRRRRQAQAHDGLIASRTKGKGSPCERDDDFPGGEIEIYSGPSLSEDVWSHIHSLMPMRDAARAACVSHAFLHSWRRHPNLTFNDITLGLNTNAPGNNDIAKDFSSKVDQILKQHSGVGVKTLNIQILKNYNVEDYCKLNRWLQITVTPGIEELTLRLPMNGKYNFPCSLLSNGSGDSIRYLHLSCCYFRPTAQLGWLSLTRLHLSSVYIKGDELGCLLSHSVALERLEIRYCDGIVCLKVPCTLQRLTYLEVLGCGKLQVIDSECANISSFYFQGDPKVQLLLGETLQMKNLCIFFSGALRYARVELPSSMPNLETAIIDSSCEMANTPMLHSKYLHLKNLSITLIGFPFSPAYDYFSLISFFDACPSLETFVLNVSQRKIEHVSIFTDPSNLRRMRGQYHHKMKSVQILGFSSVKSLVELTCHVVECVTSLECLTLEAHQSSFKCYVPGDNCSKCSHLPNDVLMEAQRALLAIRTYIEPKVPSTVKLHVVKPCIRCHAVQF